MVRLVIVLTTIVTILQPVCPVLLTFVFAEQGIPVPRHVGVPVQHVWLRRDGTRGTVYELVDPDGRREHDSGVFSWRGIRARNLRC